MSTQNIAAIDVHAHYGNYRNRSELHHQFMSAPAIEVIARAKTANTVLSVVSPLQALTPRGKYDVPGGNDDATRIVDQEPALLQWVVVDPRDPRSFLQAQERLGNPRCAGIKLHPEEHLYPIKEYGRQLFEFAAKHSAEVLIHSGEENSLPEDCVPFANDFPEMQLILAHHGCGYDGDPSHQVRAIQSSKNGNIYTDTSSAQSIMPHLIEWGVKEVGAGKLLFGTDTPLYFAPMQRVRIDEADLDDEDKKAILQTNAVKLLNLSERFDRIIANGGDAAKIQSLKELLCQD